MIATPLNSTCPRPAVCVTVAALSLFSLLGACGQRNQQFAGKEYDVSINTVPPGGTVWVVDYNQYLAKDIGKAFAAGTDPDRSWMLASPAPATFRGQAYAKMALATLTRDAKTLRGATPKPFTPGTDKSVTIPLEPK